jgi:hypothetical protein
MVNNPAINGQWSAVNGQKTSKQWSMVGGQWSMVKKPASNGQSSTAIFPPRDKILAVEL